jgi:hypothetical protein
MTHPLQKPLLLLMAIRTKIIQTTKIGMYKTLKLP